MVLVAVMDVLARLTCDTSGIQTTMKENSTGQTRPVVTQVMGEIITECRL